MASTIEELLEAANEEASLKPRPRVHVVTLLQLERQLEGLAHRCSGKRVHHVSERRSTYTFPSVREATTFTTDANRAFTNFSFRANRVGAEVRIDWST